MDLRDFYRELDDDAWDRAAELVREKREAERRPVSRGDGVGPIDDGAGSLA